VNGYLEQKGHRHVVFDPKGSRAIAFEIRELQRRIIVAIT
jgi:hypothetical protein